MQWAAAKRSRNLLIEPGKSSQNGSNDGFNGKVIDEYLVMNWLYSRAQAKTIIEKWYKHYNEVRYIPF